MQSFQERFKSKSSTVGRTGELNINPNRAVVRPTKLQMHDSVIQNSGRAIVDQNLSFNSYAATKVPSSAKQSRKIISPKRQLSQAPPSSFTSPLEEFQPIKERISDFKPYTLQDYQSIKPSKYYILGGLGPGNVGTEDWTRRKNLSDKRNDYGKKVARGKKAVLIDSLEIIESINSRITHERHSSAFT